jgi:3-oxoacyl-[acyl-carrier protein] reductase
MNDPRRNVIVTGASRGLGLGVAIALADAGYNAIAIARNHSDMLQAAIERIAQAANGGLHFVAFDLENLEDTPALIAGLRKMHGPIFGLVNNAGISHASVLANASLAEMERVVRFNTLAPMVMTKHVARSMMSAGSGRIVNISSIVASTGFSGLSVYSATKASMVGFTRALARELGPLDITVNAIAPGFVQTDMTAEMTERDRSTIARRSALKRTIDIEDVANAVVFLMDDKARNITGTVLTIDAGNTA